MQVSTTEKLAGGDAVGPQAGEAARIQIAERASRVVRMVLSSA